MLVDTVADVVVGGMACAEPHLVVSNVDVAIGAVTIVAVDDVAVSYNCNCWFNTTNSCCTSCVACNGS